MSLAERVVDRLAARRENVSEAARAAGIGYATLYGITKGERTNPSRETLEKLAAHLRVSVSWLLTGEEEPPAPAPESSDAALATETVRGLEQMIRQMGGDQGVAPEELRMRRMDALEGMRRMLSAQGPVPGWWYRLKEQVERGEL